MRRRASISLVLALLAAGCGPQAGAVVSPGEKDLPPLTSKVEPPSPARYFITYSTGATFDEASRGLAVPHQEFAIVEGRRAQLDGGIVKTVSRSPSGLVGFRSLPERLGGGYLIWSDIRTYHARDFLGSLTPVAEIGPTAGARPWFGKVLLRADRGVFALDTKTRVLTRYRPHFGIVDALSMDDKRAVTLDVVGRVRLTTDSGATWTDITEKKGFFANGMRLGDEDDIELISLTGSPELKLTQTGMEVIDVPKPPPRRGRRSYRYSSYPYQYVNPAAYPDGPKRVEPISRLLAAPALGWAASAGVLLAGDRALVGKERGVSIVSTRSGAEIVGSELFSVAAQYSNCQPVRALGGDARAGSAPEMLLLTCSHAQGAHVLVLTGPVGAPKLEATFPDKGAFLSDSRGHLAFMGRCGRTPPSADDFGARVAAPRYEYDDEDYGGPYGGYSPYGGYNPDYEEPSEPSDQPAPASDEKRVCVRLNGGDWIEHRLSGDDAKDVYRWVLGDDGSVTALLLEGVSPDSEEDKEKDGPADKYEDDEDEDDGEGGPLRKRSKLDARPVPSPLLASDKGGAKPPPKTSPPAKPAGSAQPVTKAKPTGSAQPVTKAKPAGSAKPVSKPKFPKISLRTVRLDPKDKSLKGAKWVGVPAPRTAGSPRSVDPSFWLEENGTIRGWVRLPDEDGGSDEPEESESKKAPVSTEYSGRFAGARISPDGKVEILALPKHVRQVLFGGPYGFAKAEDDSGERTEYYETTDGGATWIEVIGPPVGDIEELYDDERFPACSALGCSLSPGVVRVGWSSEKPEPPKKESEPKSLGDDPFPVPRLPRLECRLKGDPETFPPPKPAPKSAPKPALQPRPTIGQVNEDIWSQLPPDIQKAMRSAGAIPGLLPPGAGAPGPVGSASPVAPLKKPLPGAKPPPPPPADIISIRTKPKSSLGQLKDKSWVGDFLAPFDPAARVKHVTTSANGLSVLVGSVLPLLGERGPELLATWVGKRTVLGSASPFISLFDYNGRLGSAVVLSGTGRASAVSKDTKIAALDEDRRVLLLLQVDASGPVLRTARVADPMRGKLALARRIDAPGVALLWYSTTSGEVLAGEVDFGRAEIRPLSSLASLDTLTDGGLPICASAPIDGPTYEVLMDTAIGVRINGSSGKSYYDQGAAPAMLFVRASKQRLCVSALELLGGGRPVQLTASFGPKGSAVVRSPVSAEDPTKLQTDNLSCILKETESR